MIGITRTGRVTGPLSYLTAAGTRAHVPLGPCLLETVDAEQVDIVWGANGQKSALLPLSELLKAKDVGNLVLLD